MKATLKMFLPLIAAVLLATSCSKDDNNESDVVVNDEQPTVVNNGQVTNEEGMSADIVTFPFSVRVSTGNPLSKIAFSGTEGTSEYTVQFDDEVDLGKKLTVTAVHEEDKDYSDVTGELVLKKDEEGKYWFDGSISAVANAAALKDGSIKLKGSFEGGEVFSGYKISTKSLGDLMNDADVKHHFLTKEFNFKSETIWLLDQVAYFCIEVAETQEKFDLTIGETPETFTSTSQKKFWIAVSVGTVVKGNLISISGKTAEAGRIYKANRTKDVDLGLENSILWATCNLGASSPNEYGKYYAWGEATGYAYDDGHSFDNDDVSNENFQDAATVWNSNYRMPTYTELNQLSSGTFKKADDEDNAYGVSGLLFSNDYGSVFLPAAGVFVDDFKRYNENLFYWSSTPESSSYAYDLCIPYVPHYELSKYRHYGMSVRPVRLLK